jgi:alanine dehydrogenase
MGAEVTEEELHIAFVNGILRSVVEHGRAVTVEQGAERAWAVARELFLSKGAPDGEAH